MAFTFPCPQCRARLLVGGSQPARLVHCPRCNKDHPVPAPPTGIRGGRPVPTYPTALPHMPPPAVDVRRSRWAFVCRHPRALAAGLVTVLVVGSGLTAALAYYAFQPASQATEGGPAPEPARVVEYRPAPVQAARASASVPRPPAKPSHPSGAKKPLPPRPRPLSLARPLADFKPEKAVVRAFKRRDQSSAEELRKQLLAAPEIDLDAVPQTGFQLRQAAAAARIKGKLFVGPAALQSRRDDLAGLNLRRGLECHLGKEPAETLQALSIKLRAHVAACLPKGGVDVRPDPELLRQRLLGERTTTQAAWLQPEAVPVLIQMLQAENKPLRLVLVEVLSRIRGREAGAALAVRALTDLSAEVREAAVRALAERPADEYRALLVAGLRYPWPAVADHAAEALAALHDRESVPLLVQMLSEPDPGAPYLGGTDSKPALFVRRVVRVNHLRNCVLCHSPSADSTDLVRAAVPVPGRPLPAAPGTQYYHQGVLFVRADVTYLRQDFSVMQAVAQPGPWPAHQRYDYMVQARRVSLKEAAWPRAEGVDRTSYPQREAVLFALRELTGQDLGKESAAWQRVLPRGERLPVLADLAASPTLGEWRRFIPGATR